MVDPEDAEALGGRRMVRDEVRQGIGSEDDPVGASHFETINAAEVSGVATVDPSEFGGDAGQALNDAISADGSPKRYAVWPGDWSLETAVDLTGFDTITDEVVLDLRGSVLTQSGANVGIDATGTNASLKIIGGVLRADPQDRPDVGLLLARSDDGSSAGGHRLFGFDAVGKFSVANLYNVSSEVNDYYGCRFSNKEGGSFGPSGARAVYIGGNGDGSGVTSPHSTIGDTTASTHDNHFHGGRITGPIGLDLRPGDQNPVKDLHLDSVYMGGDSDAIRWVLDHGAPDRVVLDDVRITDDVPTRAIGVVQTGSLYQTRGTVIRGGVLMSTGTDIDLGVSGDGVSMRESQIRRPEFPNANGIQMADFRESEAAAVLDGQTLTIDGTIADSDLWWSNEADFSATGAARTIAVFPKDGTVVRWGMTTDDRSNK